jgi:glycosyltransferase involved in cell wall biosynthesis
MKTLIFNSLYHPNIIGGAERSVRIMAEGLTDRGVEVSVVSTADKDSFARIADVSAYYIKAPNLYWMKHAKKKPAIAKPLWHLIDSYNPLVVSKIKSILEQEKPDIVHTNNLAGLSVSVWKTVMKMNIPIVHTIRDHYLLCPKSVMFKNNQNCKTQCLTCGIYSVPRKKLSNNIDAVIGVSEFILNKHLNYGCFKNTKIKTHIYNAVNNINMTNNNNNMRDDLTFGFIGILAPIKGIEYLLERFSNIGSNQARLKIFGRGVTKSYDKYLRQNYQSEFIEFMGHQNIKDIYDQLDVVIIPSLCDDSFPRVVMESYSYGLPLITSNMGGAFEMVVEGKTGFVYDPTHESKLEELIQSFIDHPGLANEMKSACMEAAKSFTVDRLVSEVIDVYEKVLKENSVKL